MLKHRSVCSTFQRNSPLNAYPNDKGYGTMFGSGVGEDSQTTLSAKVHLPSELKDNFRAYDFVMKDHSACI